MQMGKELTLWRVANYFLGTNNCICNTSKGKNYPYDPDAVRLAKMFTHVF